MIKKLIYRWLGTNYSILQLDFREIAAGPEFNPRKHIGSFANSTASATNMNSSSQQGSFLSPEILQQMGIHRETNKSFSSNRIKNRAISNDFSRNDDALRKIHNQIKIQPFEAQNDTQQNNNSAAYNYRPNSKVGTHHKKANSMNKEFAFSMK